HLDRVAVRVRDAKLSPGRVERCGDGARRDSLREELVAELCDVIAVDVEEDRLLRRDDRVAGEREHQLRVPRPQVCPRGAVLSLRNERVDDFESELAIERDRSLDALDEGHRHERAHRGRHPSTLPWTKGRSSSGSEPKRRMWPSKSSTWISSAQGKFRGSPRSFAPLARYSSYSAEAFSTPIQAQVPR